MTLRRIDAFFYGLFMDSAVLHEAGVDPRNPRRATVDDYALRIGQRATLVPQLGAKAYGMLFTLTHDELERLYAAPGLADYRPEAVVTRSQDGDSVPALCYNLRKEPGSDEANPEYAAQLREVLRGLDFPEEYVDSVR